ncbi:2-phospho-L-lactate guanylyltransferase [Herbiconiux sp. 11R-BC]|uniref:2-phospho-L-lactate guanylyltransferase n=1 Tax=Herbiconiux sp. 11R-BC TaxID=3111637 RepID=UPI003BFF2024
MSDSPLPESALRWTVVVPVKGTADGKSRMAPALSAEQRMRLVEAFALDAVSALIASPRVARVIVVTDAQSAVAAPLGALGADIVPDPGAGLNAAVAAGIAAASAVAAARIAGPLPTAGVGSTAGARGTAGVGQTTGLTPAAGAVPTAVAALLGDLPCLTTADVDAALEAAAAHPLAVVPDAEGTGTTLITALPGVPLVPRFGAGSAARHTAAGHAPLELPPTSTLRLDVDTAADLARAEARGLGPATALVVADAARRHTPPPSVTAP